MLQSRVTEFRKSDLWLRISIVQSCIEWIQARWQGDTEFDYPEVEKVCLLFLSVPYLSWFSSLSGSTYTVPAERERSN